MKTLAKQLLLILAILWGLVSVQAGTVVLTWQDQPGCDFHIWSGTTLLKTSKDNEATLTLPDSGLSTIRVTAFIPGSYGESAPAEITVLPITVQQSADLKAWTAVTTLYVEHAPAMFFRLTPPAVTP